MTLSPRTRATLADYATVVVAACLLVALAGGYVAATTHLGGAERTEQRTAGTWTVASEFDHGATVREDTPVFDAGDRLERRSLYFTRLAPELDGAYVLRQNGTDAEPATVTAELRLVRQAVDTTGGDRTVYWRDSDRIASVEGATLSEGDPVRLPFAVNVTAQERRIAEIERSIGASPGTTEVLLVAEVTVEGGAAGTSFTDARVERLELQPGGGIYTVSTAVAEPTTREAVETVTVDGSPGPLRAYGSVALLVVGLVGAVAVAAARRSGALDLDPAERRRVRFERHRSEFDDWISAGRVPATDGPTVRLDTLEDVVDVAIDSNRRVVESEGRFHVLVDDVRYSFVPEGVDPVPPTDRDGPRAEPAEAAGSNADREGRESPRSDGPTDPGNSGRGDAEESAAARGGERRASSGERGTARDDRTGSDESRDLTDDVTPFDMSELDDDER